MKSLLAFLLGIAVGAAAALLFAPVAGEELRERLATQAASEWETAQAQWHKSMDSMQGQMARMQTQLQNLAKGQEAEEAEIAEVAEQS
jgi:gas vesicle protein